MDLTLLPAIQAKYNLPPVENIHATLPKNRNKPPWRLRNREDIKLIVVHHTASTAALINQAKYHISAHNWYTLAYHTVIDRGRILQTNDMLSLTSHALGVNDFAIGVCVNWDLRLRDLTKFEHDALIGVILSLKAQFPNAEVMGHGEASKKWANHYTSCPVISMNKLRSDIVDAEEQMDFQSQKAHDAADAFKFATRIKDLGNKLTGTRWAAEASRKVLKLAPVAAELGFTEGEETTATQITSRVIEIYNQSSSAKFEDEGFAHLMVVTQYAKKIGLL